MKHHPYSDIFPTLKASDYAALKADIAANGLLKPILTYRDEVIDGRHRERACEELGLPPRYEPIDAPTDIEALKMVVANNMFRRRLGKIERAFAAEKYAALRHGGVRHRSRDRISGEASIMEAAAAFGTTRSIIQRARAIRTYGTEDDMADVLSGRVKISTKATVMQAKGRELRKARPPNAPKAAPERQAKPPLSARELAARRAFLERKQAPAMSQEEWRRHIDPEFTGTAMDWVDKYGHVQVKTAEEYQTMRFGTVAGNWRALAKCWRGLPHDSRPIDLNWLRSPKPGDVSKLREALEFLRPIMGEAEMTLACAEAALEKKVQKA